MMNINEVNKMLATQTKEICPTCQSEVKKLKHTILCRCTKKVRMIKF